MKKIFLLVFAVTFFFLAGCGSSDKLNKIVVGIDDEFPPMSFHDADGKLVGFDIDLATEAAERMGVDVEFRPIDWDKKREEITSGRVDMIWNGLNISEERKEYMVFSKSYMDDRQVLLVRKDNPPKIFSENDLEGKIVATQAGSTSTDYFNQNPELKAALADHKVYAKFNEELDALRSGKVDVIVCDELIARYEISRGSDDLQIIEVKIGKIVQTGIGFPKDKLALRDKVQKAFDEMIADGTARKISEKWFKADVLRARR